MYVAFVEVQSGAGLLTTVSQDVAGLLAACQGDSITFPFGTYKYEFHSLDHCEEDGEFKQELVVYMKTL